MEDAGVGNRGWGGVGWVVRGQIRLKVVRMSLVFRETGPTSPEQPSDAQCAWRCKGLCRPEPPP